MRQSHLTRQLERHDPMEALLSNIRETKDQEWFRLASQRLREMNEESSK